MTAKTRFSASCTCGQVTLEAVGAPILSAVCYCESCRLAARDFERAPGAPSVVNGDGGVDYCLFSQGPSEDHARRRASQGASPHRGIRDPPRGGGVLQRADVPRFYQRTLAKSLSRSVTRGCAAARNGRHGEGSPRRPCSPGRPSNLSNASGEFHDQTAGCMGCNGFSKTQGGLVIGTLRPQTRLTSSFERDPLS